MEQFEETFEKKGIPGEDFVVDFIKNNFDYFDIELTRKDGYCLFDGWLTCKTTGHKKRIEIKANYKADTIMLEMTHINTKKTACTGWWLKEILDKNIDIFFFTDTKDNLFMVDRDTLVDYYYKNVKYLDHYYFSDALLYVVDTNDLTEYFDYKTSGWLLKDGINLLRKEF